MTKLMSYKQVDVDNINEFLLEQRDWDLQQKVDGIRARLVVNGKIEVLGGAGKRLVSTTAAPVVEKLYALGATLQGTRRLEVEGEIVGNDFWAFDLPFSSKDGVDYSSPWEERKQALISFVEKLNIDWIKPVPFYSSTEDKTMAWSAIVSSGVEGAILKHRYGRVTDGERVDHVLKAKITHTIDCFVIERGPGNGRNGTGNWIKLGLHKKDGTVYEAGRCSIIGKPVANAGDVIEVKYLYAGAGGRLVQPTHLKNRPDKVAQDCKTDQLRFVNKKVLQLEGGE